MDKTKQPSLLGEKYHRSSAFCYTLLHYYLGLEDNKTYNIKNFRMRLLSMFCSISMPYNKWCYQSHDAFEFRNKVLNWKVDSILGPETSFDCVPRESKYLSSHSYYTTFKPLIIAEARATLKECLQLYKQGKIQASTLKVGAVKIRRAGDPQDLEMNGSIRGFDSKLEVVLLQNIITNQLFFGQISLKNEKKYRGKRNN